MYRRRGSVRWWLEVGSFLDSRSFHLILVQSTPSIPSQQISSSSFLFDFPILWSCPFTSSLQSSESWFLSNILYFFHKPKWQLYWIFSLPRWVFSLSYQWLGPSLCWASKNTWIKGSKKAGKGMLTLLHNSKPGISCFSSSFVFVAPKLASSISRAHSFVLVQTLFTPSMLSVHKERKIQEGRWKIPFAE